MRVSRSLEQVHTALHLAVCIRCTSTSAHSFQQLHVIPLPCPAGSSARVVTAADLAVADVVLTTYDVLRRDVNHCPDAGSEEAGAGHSLRGRKKYQAGVCIGWLAEIDWTVCLVNHACIVTWASFPTCVPLLPLPLLPCPA